VGRALPYRAELRGRTPLPALRWECQRSFSSQGDDKSDAIAFIKEKGWSEEIAQGVVDTLASPGSGIPRGSIYITVKAMAGRPEVGEDAGLEALCKSVMQEVAVKQGKAQVKFKVYPQNAEPFECQAIEGMSLKDVAEHGIGEGAHILGEYIECACSGVMACSTCHVYVDEDWRPKVGEPSDSELDMIELAYEPKDNSRLGCQIKLTAEMNGMVLRLPGGANNMFDHIPFD